MKKIIYLILLGLFFIPESKAQTNVGGGLLFYQFTGLEVKADFGITEKISISPSAAYFLNSGSLNMFSISATGHYNLGDPEAFNFYPLAGLNLVMVSANVMGYHSSGSHIGLELGGGATYSLSETMKLYGEIKYIGHGIIGNNIGIGLGVYFNL